MINIDNFHELFNLGLHPVPIQWDVDRRIVTKHPEHIIDTTNGIPSIADVQRWLLNGMRNANGIAIKMFPPFGFFDFDLKNTSNKKIYSEWFNIVNAHNPDLLRKVCIETTRSAGYHVYIKYHKLQHKNSLAKNNGAEVISVYTGGLLSYCDPSPGYKLIHNDFADIQDLTDDEYELMVSTAALFNEDKDFVPGTPLQPIEYPIEYENLMLQFDSKITDEAYEVLLNSIDLYRVKDDRLFRSKKFIPFLRKGSTASYSAKVYMHSKRLLIFSASMTGFPSWHDSAKTGDNRWSLSPAKIVYYKNRRSWQDTITEIRTISDSAGLDIVEGPPVTKQLLVNPDRLRFPYDIFPDSINHYIAAQTIQHEYLAGSVLAAVSTAIGNSATLEAMDGYLVKPILYLAIVAPPGASKSPALKKAFDPLERYDAKLYEQYSSELQAYKEQLGKWENNKKESQKPERPNFPQTLIKDSTIEMVIKILSHNTLGCCVLADELSGFLNRMNQYKTGDEVQKWLEMWSGSPVLLQRITREENKVQEPFCNVVGGIQPGVLESLSSSENEHNGFYHRFLFVYPEPQQKSAWSHIVIPDSVKHEFHGLFADLIRSRLQKTKYFLKPEAETLYAEWFNNKNQKYNRSHNDHIKGIIAKYQDYCLRFALILQVVHDGSRRQSFVDLSNMERAIRLTEYFFGNMNKAIKILKPDSPADKLQPPYSDLYKALPEAFSHKAAIIEGEKIGIKTSTVKMFINRNVNVLFNLIERGVYEKMY